MSRKQIMHLKGFSPNMLPSLVVQGMVNISAFVLLIHRVLSLTEQEIKISSITINKKDWNQQTIARFTNSEHCQRGMHQNESRAAGINSCNFCCSNGICSNREVGTTITLYCIQLDTKSHPSRSHHAMNCKAQTTFKLSTLILPPAIPNAPSFGITSNGNSAFSQY